MSFVAALPLIISKSPLFLETDGHTICLNESELQCCHEYTQFNSISWGKYLILVVIMIILSTERRSFCSYTSNYYLALNLVPKAYTWNQKKMVYSS